MSRAKTYKIFQVGQDKAPHACVTIPKPWLRAVGLRIGDKVEVSYTDKELTVRLIGNRKEAQDVLL